MNFDLATITRLCNAHGFGSDQARRDWLSQRLVKEEDYRRAARATRIDVEALAAGMFRRLIVAMGLAARGNQNAACVRLSAFTFNLTELPAAFDGYRIMHISDPHFGSVDGTYENIIETLTGIEADLCVFTGDYWRGYSGCVESTAASLAGIASAVGVRDGALATLGKHDSADIVAPLESRGIFVLANEAVRIHRDGEDISITGVDDTHAFHTPAAEHALTCAPDGFKIFLSHTPGLAPQAARAGFDLYLCGHTHGGQICLPGGHPIVTAMGFKRRFAKAGAWRAGKMAGITNAGAGVALLPWRFHSRSEVCLVTLRRTP